MSDASNKPSGPAMICATKVVNPGRARLGSLGGGINLPRTVEILTLVFVGVGAFFGLALALLVPVGGGAKFMYGAAFGGTAGWFFATYSPLKDESLMTWLGLKIKTVRRQRYVEGQAVVLAVGCAPVDRYPIGKMRLLRGAVHIPKGTHDERGVPRSAANKNLPEGAIAVAGGWMMRHDAGAVRELKGGAPLPEEIDGRPRRKDKTKGRGKGDAPAPVASSSVTQKPARRLED